MATIIKADGTRIELKGEGPEGTLTLEQMKKAVSGPTEGGDGWVDIFAQGVLKPGAKPGSTRSSDYDKKRLVVNDNGLLLKLPMNREATRLYLSTRPDVDSPVVGDVILAEWDEID